MTELVRDTPGGLPNSPTSHCDYVGSNKHQNRNMMPRVLGIRHQMWSNLLLSWERTLQLQGGTAFL